MKKTIHKNLIVGLIVLLTLSALLFMPQNSMIAYADNVEYSSVMTDLQKDSTFDVADYPMIEDNHSLQIIQLAESTDNEIIIYTYQPSGQAKGFVASSINISTTIDDEIDFKNYPLFLANSEGVFFKYIVQGLTAISAPKRYYAISSIYRPFDEDIDKPPTGDNVVTEVNYDISKQYGFSTENGETRCEVVDIETITVTDKFVGLVRYPNGFELTPTACDSHFIAFNTDKRIDRLFEADVYYTMQDYGVATGMGLSGKPTFHEKKESYAYLTGKKVAHQGNGLFAAKYEWKEIQTVQEFMKSVERDHEIHTGGLIDVTKPHILNEDEKDNLNGKKWVLRFAVTNYSIHGGIGSVTEFGTFVGDTTILRLKFKTDGKMYNLGVIDNKQSGDGKPVNTPGNINISVSEKGKNSFWIIVGVLIAIAVILLLVLLVNIFSTISRAIPAQKPKKKAKRKTKKKGKGGKK